MGKVLTVRERAAIRKRNPGNPDIQALLAEGDELRKYLAAGSTVVEGLNKELENVKGKKCPDRTRSKANGSS